MSKKNQVVSADSSKRCFKSCPADRSFNWILGVHSAAEATFVFIAGTTSILEHLDFGGALQISILLFLLNFLMTISLIIGASWRNPYLMLPWLYLQPMKLLATFIALILAEVTWADPTVDTGVVKENNLKFMQALGIKTLFGLDLLISGVFMIKIAFKYTAIRLEHLAVELVVDTEEISQDESQG